MDELDEAATGLATKLARLLYVLDAQAELERPGGPRTEEFYRLRKLYGQWLSHDDLVDLERRMGWTRKQSGAGE